MTKATILTCVCVSIGLFSRSVTAQETPSNARQAVQMFQRRAPGAVARPLQDKLDEFVSVKDFGAQGDGRHDDTSAFQAAVNTKKKIYVPCGIYLISDTIAPPFDPSHVIGIEGENAGCTTLFNDKNSKVLIHYQALTDGNGSYGFFIRDVKLAAANGIALNSNDPTGDRDFTHRGSLLSVDISNNSFVGTYTPNGNRDPAYHTAAVPTRPDLARFGVAISCSKCIDANIQNNQIQEFGIGLLLDGADISNVRGGRIFENGVNIWNSNHDTWGGRIKIDHVDLLSNARVGGITLEGPTQTTIQSCFFEDQQFPSSVYIRSVSGDTGTKIIGNYFSETGRVPLWDLSSHGDILFEANSFSGNGKTATSSITPFNYQNTVWNYATFLGNGPGFPVTPQAGVQIGPHRPLVLSPFNVPEQGRGESLIIQGPSRGQFPFKRSTAASGQWVVGTGSSSDYLLWSGISIPSEQISDIYELDITGRNVTKSSTNGFANVKYSQGGVTTQLLSNVRLNLPSSIHTARYIVRMPSNFDGSGSFQIAVYCDNEYTGIVIKPVAEPPK